jgi:hypothetical protein
MEREAPRSAGLVRAERKEYPMPILLWLLGIPIPIIILLVLFAR